MDKILEPTPKEEELKVSQDDAKALYEFIDYVGRECYDKFGENGHRGKSWPLLKMLERMDSLLNTLIDYPEVEEGLYWTPYEEMNREEAHPKLLEAISQRTGIRLFCVSLFDSAPFGYLELAVHGETGQTCGLFVLPRGFEETVLGPQWIASSADLNETIKQFVEAIPMDQLFPDTPKTNVARQIPTPQEEANHLQAHYRMNASYGCPS